MELAFRTTAAATTTTAPGRARAAPLSSCVCGLCHAQQCTRNSLDATAADATTRHVSSAEPWRNELRSDGTASLDAVVWNWKLNKWRWGC